MKYFVFSIDDGTIYDQIVANIFDEFGIHATFNLNSGLQNFVWYKNDRPVERLNLTNYKDIYALHEVSSHSLSHFHLTECPDDVISREVNEDIYNLEEIFQRKVTTFAFPFQDFDDRCINVIRQNPNITAIRVSELDRSFKMPVDQFHIKITSWNIDEALGLVNNFIQDENAELFVFVGHAYDFEFDSSYEKLIQLCQIVTSNNDIKCITMNELSQIIEN